MIFAQIILNFLNLSKPDYDYFIFIYRFGWIVSNLLEQRFSICGTRRKSPFIKKHKRIHY